MTAPLRRQLLNGEIRAQARAIAHRWTHSCRGEGLPIDHEHHTPNCNQLYEEIVFLAIDVKLAGMQPPPRRDPPPFSLEGDPQHD